MADEGVATNGFTTKEMLVRMDGKLDVVAGNQRDTDIQVAMLKERVARVEDEARMAAAGGAQWRDEVRKELAAGRAEAAKLGRKLAYATGTIAGVVLIANWWVPKLLGPHT